MGEGRRVGSAAQAGEADGPFRGGGEIGIGKHRSAKLTGGDKGPWIGLND